MTGERLGPLGRRLLVAFAAVALGAVVLVTVAGLVGSERGLSSQSAGQRQEVAQRAASAAAEAYADAGGWAGADLGVAENVAAGGGAFLTVVGADGMPMQGQHGPGHHRGDMPWMGPETGTGAEDGGPRVTAPVRVDGEVVGEAVLRFGVDSRSNGRPVAWAWILIAGAAALCLALLAAWFVSRQLSRPVTALTAAARSFAAGDRDAVVTERGHGELAELADALQEAMVAVRRAEASRSRMAADVAHELRTPLAALQAGLEELRDGFAPADPAALARLHDQALRIGQIVGDLDTLFAAEGATRVVRKEPVDLTDLVREEVASRTAQLRVLEIDVHLDLAVDGDMIAIGDRERVHQVLGNLLENCARHCRAGDSVTVGLRADAGSVVLTVTDTGPGIPPEDLPHVFDRFWRGASQPARPGSGLGLAVVRSLTEAMHGSVSVESDGSTGTAVTVRLPRAPVVAGPA